MLFGHLGQYFCLRRGGKLAIVNLQRTPLDSLCAVRIFARSDEVLAELMAQLGLEVPPLWDRMQVAAQDHVIDRLNPPPSSPAGGPAAAATAAGRAAKAAAAGAGAACELQL